MANTKSGLLLNVKNAPAASSSPAGGFWDDWDGDGFWDADGWDGDGWDGWDGDW